MSFLSRIAEAYCSNEPDLLIDCCFVFPNKRSGAFFSKYLRGFLGSGTPAFFPEITTVSDFIASLSDLVVAPRYDQLFALYNEYKALSPEVRDFDQFVYWGDMLLADFADVDRYLVDAHALFRNIRNYREIEADYLTPEQKEVINRYWGLSLPLDDPDIFWRHIDSKGNHRVNRESFLSLWRILGPLYENFRTALRSQGLCYGGMQYREVATRMRSMTAADFPYRRIVMVGFNALSIAELKIFERLKELGIGDFYWDYSLPEEVLEGNAATRFLKRYVREFPSRYDVSPDNAHDLPHIDIVGVPSAVGQVKYAGRLLSDMVSDGSIASPANAVDTAVVLPSEDMFIELLHSIPPEIGAVNITMGYPLKNTPVATLIRSVTTMHLHARRVRDKWCFFYQDVSSVLASPLLGAIAPQESDAMRDAIERDRMYSIPVEWIADNFPSLSPIFYAVDDLRRPAQVMGYLCDMVDYLMERIKALRVDGERTTVIDPMEDGTAVAAMESAEDSPTAPSRIALPGSLNLELGFLTRYRQSLDMLWQALCRHHIDMRESTFFHLIDRTLADEAVSFVGEPLNGLQIMGVLETRALNFDNLIVLSMNERVFPRKFYSRSFIPEVLRRSFAMSTTEFQECIFAYYFYRMVFGARRVTLLYDTRAGLMKSADMSRYLYQLIYLYTGVPVRRRQASYLMCVPESRRGADIPKTPQIMERIEAFRKCGEGEQWLSPSSINEYLQCPMRFYFSKIAGVSVRDEVLEYIDEGTMGTILHQVAEWSYMRLRGSAPALHVTADLLDSLIKEESVLRNYITSAVNRHFNRLPSQVPLAPDGRNYVNLTPLHGEAKVVHNILLSMMKRMFELEKRRAPFEFISGEERIYCRFKVNDRFSFNLKGVIDRVDREPDGTFTIVDYKTGGDVNSVADVSRMFEPVDAVSSHPHAMVQLFIYANALNMRRGVDMPVRPMLYCVRKFASSGLSPLVIGKEEVYNYLDFNDSFLDELYTRLSPLFDPDVPFKANPSVAHCNYCKFIDVCGSGIRKTR